MKIRHLPLSLLTLLVTVSGCDDSPFERSASPKGKIPICVCCYSNCTKDESPAPIPSPPPCAPLMPCKEPQSPQDPL